MLLISCHCYWSNSNTKYTRRVTWLRVDLKSFVWVCCYTRLRKKHKKAKVIGGRNHPYFTPQPRSVFWIFLLHPCHSSDPWFVMALQFVALIVVLLSIYVPGAVSRFSVSAVTAPMGLISVVVITMWGIVVHVFTGIIFWLQVGRVSTLLSFRVKCLLPGEALTYTAAMLVMWGWGGGMQVGFWQVPSKILLQVGKLTNQEWSNQSPDHLENPGNKRNITGLTLGLTKVRV